MEYILLQKDYEYLSSLDDELKAESKELTKKLGEYAAHGGAVPFQIPEYQATDDRLRTIKERFHQVNKVLKNSEIVSLEKVDDKHIGFYSLVETENMENNTKESYYIVHSEIIDRLNLDKNIFAVSPKSPLGQALMGKKTGNKVKIKLPKTTKNLKIIHFEKKEY